MRINHNISALKSANLLGKTNNRLDKSLEKLSSGLRINRAADDAAGLAISRKMKTQIAGLQQAARNAADGISAIQTAEGALNEVGAMLQRMRELAVQASNGTNTEGDRDAIVQEINQLTEEIKRVSDTTEFNTKILLNGNIDRKSYSDDSIINIVDMSDTVADTSYQVEFVSHAEQAKVEGGTFDFTNMADLVGVGNGGTITINGLEVEILDSDTKEQAFTKIRDLGNRSNINVTIDNSIIAFTSVAYGNAEEVDVVVTSNNGNDILGLTSDTKYGKNAEINLGDGFESTATKTYNGKYVTVTDTNNFAITFEVDPSKATATKNPITLTVLDAGPMELQIGSNKGQTMDIRIPKIDPETLGIVDANLSTQEGAEKAIALFDKAITKVTATRAKLGAYQNRLEHSIANLDVAAENMTEALSRIEDVDMAKEMATYTQQDVLAQAGTSMLAQANQRPQTILTLLQG